MNKKATISEISVKSTKEQILSAYNDAMLKLNEKQINRLKSKRNSKKSDLVSKASDNSSDNILIK